MNIVPPRETFYGKIPSTAEEMYNHCMNITEYYFGEIGVPAENGPDILSCRQKGFEELEKQENFLENKVFEGSYGEEWSLRESTQGRCIAELLRLFGMPNLIMFFVLRLDKIKNPCF